MEENDILLTKKILKEFAAELKKLASRGVFSEKFVNLYSYQKKHRCHSRVLGVLAKIGYELGYLVDIERGWEFSEPMAIENKQRKTWLCNPDITYLNENNGPEVFIDYSTLDLPFDAFYKIPKYLHYLEHPGDGIPRSCIMVITLPKMPIKDIKGAQKWITDPDLKLNIEKFDKEKSLFDYYFEPSVNCMCELNENILVKTVLCLGVLHERGLNVVIKSQENLDYQIPLNLHISNAHTLDA